MKNRVSEPVARYIREQTAVNARILSPHPHDMTATTGRPNASGFTGLNHFLPRTGSEFLDATRYLEPAAVRRVGFKYLHAPNDWISTLPNRARQWLEEPRLFEPVARGDADALYRILPAFLRLDPEPTPQSFEALRRTIPESATVGANWPDRTRRSARSVRVGARTAAWQRKPARPSSSGRHPDTAAGLSSP